jgi:hypothetical protein
MTKGLESQPASDDYNPGVNSTICAFTQSKKVGGRMTTPRVVALIALLVLLLSTLAPAADPPKADDAANLFPKPAELKILEPAIGTWEFSFTEKRTGAEPIKGTGIARNEWIAGGRFMQISASPKDGPEALAMVTYDADKKQFHRWYFHSRMGFLESWGTFDEKSQAFAWKSDHPGGVTSTLVDRYVDKESRAWNVQVKSPAGEVMFDMEATAKRTSSDAAVPTQKPLPAVALAPELKVLDRYAGTWDGQSTVKPGPLVLQESHHEDAAVAKWVLGGMFLRVDAKMADGAEAVQMMTWDAQKRQYRHWFFHSNHPPTESSGEWDEKRPGFAWKISPPPGMTAGITDQWISEKRRDWKYLLNDADGKVLLEVNGTSTRRK